MEAFEISLLLAIEGTIKTPNISAERLQQLVRSCPMLFGSIFSTGQTDDIMDKVNEEDPDESEFLPVSHGQYQDILTSRPMGGGEVQTKFGLPLRLRQLPVVHWFMQQLQEAYYQDYEIPAIDYTGSIPLRWFRRVSFQST